MSATTWLLRRVRVNTEHIKNDFGESTLSIVLGTIVWCVHLARFLTGCCNSATWPGPGLLVTGGGYLRRPFEVLAFYFKPRRTYIKNSGSLVDSPVLTKL